MRVRGFFFFIMFGAASWVMADAVTVQAGDSLWAIASRHGTTVDELMAANDLASTQLSPGDTLVLPGTVSGPPSRWTVQAGDTLYDIAQATGTSVDDLIAWNDLGDVTIRPGQELVLHPGAAAPQVATVEIGPGDTLWEIAQAHEVTVDDLATANDLAPSATLQPGQVLEVPGTQALAQADDTGDQGGYAAPVITVDAGDSLWEIARRYDTTVAALMAANDLSGSTLRPGQSLRIVNERATGSPETAADPADASAAPGDAEATAMLWPLQGPLTSRFGWRQLSVGGTHSHYGIDIDGDTGDPIVSATPGVVTFSGWMGGFGQLVIIEQGGVEYYYAHSSQRLVNEGQRVAGGDLIARVGTTGRVTGSHLHFEVRVDGSPIDPLPLLEVGRLPSTQAAAR
ncbi:MAG: LysM peptidoglycan-binding domain-containing protein [Trueperaceae bacterium]|nr:LysM peptidoglycan-binding domain-containing protein [Trueperaceae bacterium]